MQEIREAFGKIGLSEEITKIILRHKKASVKICSSSTPYKKVGRLLEEEVFSYIKKGHTVNNSGLGFAGYIRNLGYDLQDIYLAHKLASQGLTTHYYSLEAETASSFLLQHREILPLACRSFSSPSYKNIRLFVVFLAELSRICLPKYVIQNLKLRKSSDVANLPPFMQVLIKATCED
ncbi:hypothetical protein [Cedratvirus kamchatka]|uniref:Uncharacterized protein n=1 Tax=Cedratvirus kamchatka TaxID=2716914 RepID=A0A6G8MYM6_9VIRU|nr:hypothetical protein [Cedratvirus kamchatka]WIL04735.1 hypothetical protein Cduv_255 [Cedratvirus duvanny]